jgi:hypothetical protein
VNKLTKIHFFLRHAKLFISTLSIFFSFYIVFRGWAQLSPHGLGQTQPAQPGHWLGAVLPTGVRHARLLQQQCN